MRKYTLLGGIAATLLSATVVMAASPAPAATPAPTATPAPAATPAPTTSSTTTAAPKAAVPASSALFSGPLRALDLRGTATVTRTSTGATLTITLRDSVPGQAWSVDVHSAPIASIGESAAIFTASGSSLADWGTNTLKLSMSQAQYDLFHSARMSHGVVIVVQNGGQTLFASVAKG